jgi:hypothetical protein
MINKKIEFDKIKIMKESQIITYLDKHIYVKNKKVMELLKLGESYLKGKTNEVNTDIKNSIFLLYFYIMEAEKENIKGLIQSYMGDTLFEDIGVEVYKEHNMTKTALLEPEKEEMLAIVLVSDEYVKVEVTNELMSIDGYTEKSKEEREK